MFCFPHLLCAKANDQGLSLSPVSGKTGGVSTQGEHISMATVCSLVL